MAARDVNLLRDQGSTPLRELLAAVARIEAHYAGTLDGAAIARDLDDIRAAAGELEQEADRLARSLAEAEQDVRTVFGRIG